MDEKEKVEQKISSEILRVKLSHIKCNIQIQSKGNIPQLRSMLKF